MRYITLLLLTIVISSCSTYSDQELSAFDEKIKAHLDSLNKKMEKTENGLYYAIKDTGHGSEFISYKDQVTFTYKGSFLNGNTFQVIGKEDPLVYKVKQLIVGWQDALMMIKEGGKIEIIIPPQLGYATQKTDIIPANSILKYELEVLKVE
ncbi:peptidylprolyl isomerase [Brumimicrobium salinarum]|uniref:Peptidyl-prolyl cis-trans isomerase n=1 Tax=Brumimicrobium salinarum TaxID=2058658 RepID=A0A2I0R168_9FLAO|nr:FKBP-type peptidyl-prolyl cis-trans isomerase [Brumimicrobium salinarum]PKR80140.1 peptidylprolyl isomerase [Brumimicrobium salinarum]